MPRDISVPDVDVGPPQVAPSLVHAMQHIHDEEPSAKSKKIQETAKNVQVQK